MPADISKRQQVRSPLPLHFHFNFFLIGDIGSPSLLMRRYLVDVQLYSHHTADSYEGALPVSFIAS